MIQANPQILRIIRKRSFLPASMFAIQQKAFTPAGTISKPSFTVEASGAIGSNMEIGLSADAASATVEGGTGITAQRTLTTTSPVGVPTLTGTAVAIDTLLQSAGAGNPLYVENGTLGLMAFLMNTNGDDARFFGRIPGDFDRRQPLKVRTVFSTQSLTAADTIVWKFLYKTLIAGTTAIAAPATALDTAIASTTVVGTADVLQVSPWGVINANKIASGNGAPEHWAFIAEMDTKAVGLSENIHFYGLEFEYTRKLTRMSRRGKQAEAWQA